MPVLNKEDKIIVGSEVFIPFISADKIQKRIKELGEQISKDYEGKIPIFIGVLNGAFIFLADLLKNVSN
jgi:hypoxanthine phosphoribosyltransferase